ncbi:LysR family transcriptional regulator [Camelliibacillus cellulosilyticus]|uniref:LysR family transcriptional regulator n=1 Tax=Camelliibacillus cellulosilyticus TaxID=2174486 RepID=A0ABV9GM74_9BACL
MNLHALRIFMKVAEIGSVTGAAAKLLISQPAVTAQIRTLEKETGLKLLAPKGRTIQLTETGRWLAEQSHRLFALEADIEKEIADRREGKSGVLRLFATQLPARTLLTEWMVQFKKQYPDVDVQLFRGNTHHAFESLLNYEAHIAVIASEWQDLDIDSFTLFEDELVFIVPTRHRLAGREVELKEILREPFVYREKGSATRQKLMSLCQYVNVDPPRVGLMIEGLNESIEAVKIGYGAMLVPAFAVKSELNHHEVERVWVKDIHLSLPLRVCTRKKTPLFSVAKNFIAFITENKAVYQ